MWGSGPVKERRQSEQRCGAVAPSRSGGNRSKDPVSGGIPSVKSGVLQAAPTDWRQPAARSSGS
eukprot:1651607-Prymnesium_polylepis.1